MKNTHLFALALGAALSVAAPTFAQEPDKPAEAPKAEEKAPVAKDKAAKPAEADKAKAKTDAKESKESKLPQSDQEPAVKNEDKADRKDAGRMPQSDQENGQEAKRGPGGDVNDRDKQAHHEFKSDAKTKLRSSYKNITSVNRTTRVTVVREQVLPVEVRTRIEPVPVDVVSYLGPAPDGFMYGFVDGYCVVYDPNTFFVVDVIDLF